MIHVAVVDDHPHVAIAVQALLAQSPDIRFVGQAKRGDEAAHLVLTTRPDVLFLDLMMEESFDALTAVTQLHHQFPTLKICLLSAYVEPAYVRDLLKAGVSGYILKDDDYVSQIETIIRKLAGGDLYLSQQAYEALALATQQEGAQQKLLTERELEILRLLARNLRNPQIAQSLHLSPGTVRNHLSAMYRKLNARNRHEALQAAREQGLL